METKTIRNQEGITIVTVVITVIVLIIIATISVANIFTQQEAALAKYVQEFEEVRKGVESQRLIDGKEDVANADSSFSRVYVTGDVPYNFLTLNFETDSDQKMAYLVSLDVIGYDDLSTGQDYPKFEQGTGEIKTVTFGKDDVYVYDSTGRLFYAKGFNNDGKLYYENTNSNDYIKILNVEMTKNSDGTVTVKVTIESVNEVKQVTIGGQKANDVGNKKYELSVKQNGTYEIVAEDVNGNIVKQKVFVSGIESDSAPTVIATVTNAVSSEGGVYKITEGVAHIKLTSSTAKTLYIGTNSTDAPDSWLPFSENIERYYNTSGIKNLYIYVKDENNTVCTSACHLQILVELGQESGDKPIVTPEDITFGEIQISVSLSEPNSEGWSRTKYVQITYPEGKQSDGYSSMYRISTNGGTSFGRWTVSYDRIMNLEITQNTVIEAKIIYKSSKTSQESSVSTITVDKIDRIPPKITSLTSEDDEVNKRTLVKGEALDYESLISPSAYYISMQEIDFSDGKNVEDYTWQSNGEFEVIKDGKYYFYARDNVNNVAVSSINVNVIDRTPPIIKSIASVPALGQVTIRATAQDETGVVAFALTSTETEPSNWNSINEQEYVVVEGIVTTEGTYYMWVKDAAGNMAHESIVVHPYSLPVLDATYPKDVYIQERTKAEFEVKITTPGYPEKCEFEWQVSSDEGVTWQTIGGQTNSTYSFTATMEDNGKLYKCLIKHAIETIESRIAKLEVVRITTDKPGGEVIEDTEMIHGGLIINNGNKTTRLTTLSLEIVAINAYEINISETSTKDNDNWQKYEQQVEYNLKDTTPGEKTLYVWIRDANGKESDRPVSAKITLEK